MKKAFAEGFQDRMLKQIKANEEKNQLAQGTDGGGSNRIPASCCGILGMKASRYRQVSGEADGGHFFLRTHQCLSRTVRDSAALLAATENPVNRAGYPPVGLVEGPAKRRLRIAVSAENSFGEQPEASARPAAIRQQQCIVAAPQRRVSGTMVL